MPNNKSLQFLRGSKDKKESSSDILLYGQPFFETDTNLLYIGDGLSTLNTLSPVNLIYDTVIESQEDFENWYNQLDNNGYKGHSVLIKEGNYIREDGKGLCLPSTLYKIEGVGKAVIQINDFDYDENTNGAGIWYKNRPTAMYYGITGISLKVSTEDTGDKRITCFLNCINLANCTATATRNNADASSGSIVNDCIAFHQCNNLMNCTGFSKYISGDNYIPTFYGCNKLVNCTAAAISEDVYGQIIGFWQCNSLINCAGVAKGGTRPQCYVACNSIINCGSTVDLNHEPETSEHDKYINAYYYCHYCANCFGSVIGGSQIVWQACSYYSPDTCSGSGLTIN